MKLDLRQIARQPGAVLPFACELDLSGFEWNGNRPLAAPVHVEGEVRNMVQHHPAVRLSHAAGRQV